MRDYEVAAKEIEAMGAELIDADDEALRKVRGAQIGMVFQDPMTSFNPVYRIGAQIAEAIRAHRPETSMPALCPVICSPAASPTPASEKARVMMANRKSSSWRQTTARTTLAATVPRIATAMAASCDQ